MTTTKEPVDYLARIIDELQKDVWKHISFEPKPPDPMTVSNACHLAAQLVLTRIVTFADGCSAGSALAAIRCVDDLLLLVDELGGLEALGRSELAESVIHGMAFEAALLDALADRTE